MPGPKLGDRCTCLKHGVWLPHTVASDCVNPCTKPGCRSLMLPLNIDDFKRALEHFRDHT